MLPLEAELNRNQIPPEVAAVVVCTLVLAVRFSASVTSWIRTKDHNNLVGGVPTSRHLDGEATDLVYDDAPPALSDVNAIAADYGCHVSRELGPAHADGQKPFSHDHVQRAEPRHA
jgi:hypothetical protein